MGNTASSLPGCELEEIKEYRSLRRGDELINYKGVHGIYLGHRQGVAVLYEVFGYQYVRNRDLFQFDNRPEYSLCRIRYNGDNDDKREKVATKAERILPLGTVGTFIPLWIGSHNYIRTRLIP